jgi:hypothetical protein
LAAISVRQSGKVLLDSIFHCYHLSMSVTVSRRFDDANNTDVSLIDREVWREAIARARDTVTLAQH